SSVRPPAAPPGLGSLPGGTTPAAEPPMGSGSPAYPGSAGGPPSSVVTITITVPVAAGPPRVGVVGDSTTPGIRSLGIPPPAGPPGLAAPAPAAAPTVVPRGAATPEKSKSGAGGATGKAVPH